MEMGADAFLDELDALNLTSPTASMGMGDGRGRGGTGFGGGVTGSRGSPNPTQLPVDAAAEVFDFTSHSASESRGLGSASDFHFLQHQHHHTGGANGNGDMDLSNFNMFADKTVSDGGRRDDNHNGMPPSHSHAHSQSATHTQGQGHSISNSGNNANNVNFDALQQLLNMQLQMQFPLNALSSTMSMPTSVDSTPGSNHTTAATAPTTPASTSNPNATVLLEQQLRLHQLQQLQQLQNQIFQQQIELISGQTSLASSLDSTPMTTSQFQGLPTPANSTELRPQPSSNFLSPMILQNYLAQPGSQVTPSSAQFNTPHQIPQGPSSAPAHLAFSTQAPLVSPSDLDFDLSPLTSPWLGAASYQQAQQQLQQHQQSHGQTQAQVQNELKRRASKRGASSSGDDADGRAQARKRQSPAFRTSIGSGSGMGTGTRSSRKATSSRGSVSVSSTPAMRAQRSRTGSVVGEIVGDTPSPVDLSMPPPAPPSQTQSENCGSGSSAGNQPQPATSVSGSSGCSVQSSALSPVTPASIMNLGRLGLSSGLSSPPAVAEDQQQSQDTGNKGKGKSKSKTPPKSSSGASASTSPQGKSVSKRGSSTSLVSPPLKPLLPGGLSTTSAAAQLGSASNYSHHLSGSASALHIVPSTPLPPPTPAVRKTSHKAAEQKRRDSLKSSFDQLRILLPPLPLPNEEGYLGAEERLPPGAMPPRGPPRGDVTGPNRSVSKLMLLRCGNEFIKLLKGRVQRRDDYIAELKGEVRALRTKVEAVEQRTRIQGGEGRRDGDGADAMVDAVTEEIEKVDLEKDLDAEEDNAPRFGLGGPLMEAGEEADEECE